MTRARWVVVALVAGVVVFGTLARRENAERRRAYEAEHRLRVSPLLHPDGGQ